MPRDNYNGLDEPQILLTVKEVAKQYSYLLPELCDKDTVLKE